MATAIACKMCGMVHWLEPVGEGEVAFCCRCRSPIERRSRRSLHKTAALSLAALILYFPANYFPILEMDLYGKVSQSTVWSGCKQLYQDGDYVIAVIVFLASILIPLVKLAGLFFLVGSVWLKMQGARRVRTIIFQFIDVIGRWAMLDVFVLAILVSVVKLNKLATITPGRGALAFAGVVVLTLLASASFDPQLLWEEEECVE